MTQISPQPIVLKDVLLQIGVDNFEKQVSQVTLTPTASAQVWQGLSPTASYSDIPIASWAAEINLAQDHETAGSLNDYLFSNEGTKATLIFKPRSGSGPSYSVIATLTPGPIGGQVNAWAESKVTLPLDGKPTKIAAGAGIPIMGLATPATGPIAGGQLVQINGNLFTGATAVVFGAVAATSFTVVSSTLIIAVSPAAAAGSKPIKVTNPTGQSTTSAPYTFV